MARLVTRTEIIKAALSWEGTPYQHQCANKHMACDCLGLICGVWRELFGELPAEIPPYSPDWAEAGGAERLLDAARKWLVEKSLEARTPGDVLVFRMNPGAMAKHMAILIAPDMIIHAYWGRAVTRSFLAPFWIRRLAGVFSFPGCEEPICPT
ncbi:MAG TPA: peptidase P60 [Hellea balneolensis]|uniref:Peptidase P60 n=1 Tax=Hellea balneolensis TaxID=287478 RepID=A0A7V5U1D6_9PROT|nr:peptidase P60 [Hellea balneolensis]